VTHISVAVVLGGTNEERNVSLASGRAVVEALRSLGHAVVAVDPAHGAVPREEEARMLGGAVGTDPPDLAELARLDSSAVGAALAELPAIRNADVIFLALHGEDGEDGKFQALLDLSDLTYTGSGCLGSAIAFDKRVSKELLVQADVPTPPWTSRALGAREVQDALGLPLVVKPSNGGSTVGLTVVQQPEELEPAMELAARYDADVLCERFVPGRELTVAVLGGEPLPPVEIIPSHDIYDYECKYTPGMSRYEVPADISAAESARLARRTSRPRRAPVWQSWPAKHTWRFVRSRTAGSISFGGTTDLCGAWRRTACRVSPPPAWCRRRRKLRASPSPSCANGSRSRPWPRGVATRRQRPEPGPSRGGHSEAWRTPIAPTATPSPPAAGGSLTSLRPG
jgi:D-alanine-D-alanine ligase